MAQLELSDLSIQQLRTFRHVYDAGGYAAAARSCGLAVPTIWQHIRAVERVYGVRLFKKVGREVQPTAAANELYIAVDEILTRLESTIDIVAKDATDAGPIRIVAGNRMMLEDLAAPLADFRKTVSNQILIRHGNNKRAEELLLNDEADIALSLDAGPDRVSGRIHYEPAYSVDFLVVAPKRHPFAKATSRGLREIVKHPLIVTSPGTHGRDALEHALHRERLEADIHVETDNSGFTIACVQAGMGLGILAGRPDGQLCAKLAAWSLRRQLGRRQIVFMWRKGRRLTESLWNLIKTIRAARTA